jgi:hypothetical protein
MHHFRSPFFAASALLFFACAHQSGSVEKPSKPAAVPGCPLPDKAVFFEFQVERPARVIVDSTHPHPTADSFAVQIRGPGATEVQFVVDTTGTPVPITFRILKAPSNAMAQSVSSVFMRWRFTPARAEGCLVPQLVQTSVVE